MKVLLPQPLTVFIEEYDFLKKRYGIKKIDWSNFNIMYSKYPISSLSSKKLAFLLKAIRFRIRLYTKLQRLKALFTIR